MRKLSFFLLEENAICQSRVYTDGVVEARDLKGKEFWIDRLIDLVRSIKDLSAQKIVNSILSELHLFEGKVVQHDDITVIVAKVY